MISQLRNLVVVGSLVLVAACGPESNINGFLVSQKQAESIDVLMADAELAYDQGDFETAKEKAEQAFEINTQNEKVAVLLGYIYLSYAGIDPFQLAKSLISGSASSKKTETATTGTESSSAAGQLGVLADIVSVDETSLALLGTKSAPEVFAQLPVIHPSLASIARKAGVQSLEYADKAIKTICPFVSEKVLIADDPRHKREAGGSCEASPVPSKYAAKSNFLWAFSHLADALVFYNVLLYKNPGAATPNLDGRAALVKTSASDFTKYIQMVDALATDITSIFQTDNADSQLNAVLNSLTAAASAFGEIGSGAETFTAGIQKALSSLKTASTSGASTSQSKVLQSQLTTGVAKTLATKLDTLKAEKPAEYAANKTEICNLFNTIGAGAAASKPTDCN